MKQLIPHYDYPINELPPIIGQFSVIWECEGAAWGETLRIEIRADGEKVLLVYNPTTDTFENADAKNSSYLYDVKTDSERIHDMILFTTEEASKVV